MFTNLEIIPLMYDKASTGTAFRRTPIAREVPLKYESTKIINEISL